MDRVNSSDQMDVDDSTLAGPPYDSWPDSRWSLTATQPTRLASRLAAAAVAVGAVGGMVIAILSVLFGATDISPAARVLTIGLPLLLVAMIGWRLAEVACLVGSSPSGRWLAGVAATGVVLIAAIQGWPEIGGLDDGIAHSAGVALAVMTYGAIFGMAPAVAVVVVLIPTFLLLRASQVRIDLPTAQLVLTAFAMAVTAVFALWVTTELRTEYLTGTATALAGTGTVLTAGWCLGGRHA